MREREVIMNKVEVGQTVVAFWGAMHPIEECVVEWIAENGHVKIVNEEGDGHIVEMKNIQGPYAECNGVGVYTL